MIQPYFRTKPHALYRVHGLVAGCLISGPLLYIHANKCMYVNIVLTCQPIPLNTAQQPLQASLCLFHLRVMMERTSQLQESRPLHRPTESVVSQHQQFPSTPRESLSTCYLNAYLTHVTLYMCVHVYTTPGDLGTLNSTYVPEQLASTLLSSAK